MNIKAIITHNNWADFLSELQPGYFLPEGCIRVKTYRNSLVASAIIIKSSPRPIYFKQYPLMAMIIKTSVNKSDEAKFSEELDKKCRELGIKIMPGEIDAWQ